MTVEYVYGLPGDNEEVRRAALVHARFDLAARDNFDRVYAYDGTRMAQPGRRTPTGLPVVDAVLGRYSVADAHAIA